MPVIKTIHVFGENTISTTDYQDAQYVVKVRKAGKRGGKGKNVVIMQIEGTPQSCIATVEAELKELAKLHKIELPVGSWVTWK